MVHPVMRMQLRRYEDMDELEDAMGSSFAEFIEKFPIIELKADDRFTGGKVFRVFAPSAEFS